MPLNCVGNNKCEKSFPVKVSFVKVDRTKGPHNGTNTNRKILKNEKKRNRIKLK